VVSERRCRRQILNFPNGRATLNRFIGFQYWRQKHEGYGVRQVACSAADFTIDLDSTDSALNPLRLPGSASISNDVHVILNMAT